MDLCPFASSSSFALVSGSSLSSTRIGFCSRWLSSSKSREKVAEESFITSWPDVPRTAESDETRQTCSVPRCSAASRSSSVSACSAKRTSSGP